MHGESLSVIRLNPKALHFVAIKARHIHLEAHRNQGGQIFLYTAQALIEFSFSSLQNLTT